MPKIFECENGQTVPWWQRCDNNLDCEDYTDEKGCGEYIVTFSSDSPVLLGNN